MDLNNLLKSRREEIISIAARHGARNVRVFGSVARGEDDDKSDIDLLVEFESGRSLLDQAGSGWSCRIFSAARSMWSANAASNRESGNVSFGRLCLFERPKGAAAGYSRCHCL